MLYIHICLEYDEEDFVKDPNYISTDADFLNIDAKKWKNGLSLEFFATLT